MLAGSSYSFKPTVTSSSRSVGFSITNKPVWATFSVANGSLGGMPAVTQLGSYGNIVISVTDGSTTASLAPFSITVTAPSNAIPVISGTPATSVAAGTAYSFTPTASDANGDPLTFSIVNKPA